METSNNFEQSLKSKIELLERIENDIDILLCSEIERIARLELNNNSTLKEFIMCMGSYFFTCHKIGLDIVGSDISNYKSKDIDILIKMYDNKFNITGNAMRFTKDSEVVKDWGSYN